MKKTYSFYDIILVGSNEYKKILKHRFNGEIQYFPNWADQVIENKSNIKKVDIDIPNDHKVIMYTGNIGYAQNFDEIINLCFKSIDLKIFWVFVGDGRFKNKLASIAKKNPLLKIRLINSVKMDLIKSYIDICDFTLLSLGTEGIFSKTVPAKLQTYMCLSKPVLGLISGEAKEIIENSNCGIILNPSNVNESLKKLNELIKFDESQLKILGDNGKKYYDKNFNSNLRKEQLLKLFI